MEGDDAGPRLAVVLGAGGYLGTAIGRAFVARGWRVRGLIRDPGKERSLASEGVSPIVGDLLDPDTLARACRGCDVAVHVAAVDPSGPEGPERAERVRIEGSRNLVRAATANGVWRVVIGSGYWVYADTAEVITEESAIDPRGESRVNQEAERAAQEEAGHGPPEVLNVRPGMVYGDGSWFRPVVAAIRAGSYAWIGEGSNAWSFVAREDAGSGFAQIAEAGRNGEVYNLVDGRPAPWKEFAQFVADRLARPSPSSISPAEAVTNFGPDVAHHLAARRACSAAKIAALGWRPRYVDFRAGVSALLPQMVRDVGSTRQPAASPGPRAGPERPCAGDGPVGREE